MLSDPKPTVVMAGLGESSVDLTVRPWVNNADFWAVRSDLIRGLKQALTAAGYSIPFPQRDLHIIGADPTSLAKGMTDAKH